MGAKQIKMLFLCLYGLFFVFCLVLSGLCLDWLFLEEATDVCFVGGSRIDRHDS